MAGFDIHKESDIDRSYENVQALLLILHYLILLPQMHLYE
jgi:hypothetical protein